VSAGLRSAGAVRRRRSWWVWLVCLVLATLLFRGWPQLDAWVSGLFYRPELPGRFVGESDPLVLAVYQAVPHVGRWLTVLCLVLCFIPRQRFEPGWQQRWRGRAIGLLAMLVLGLGLMVNWALKEHVGRPRPVHIAAFGGSQAYQPVGQVSQLCSRNCSFVSGHASTGFVLIGLGLAGGVAARRRWWWVGAAAGLLIGACRVMQGGHFVSDILFAGLFMWGLALLVQRGWVGWRWRRRRRAALPG
jgi:lipid A 4'-phosphatase